MKVLKLGFDTEVYGTLSIRDGKIQPGGPNIESAKETAEHYAEMAERMGRDIRDPEQFLEFVAEHLQGRHWATLSEEPDPQPA